MIDHVIMMATSPTRSMQSLTGTRPKAMLPILGKPMIAHIMDGFYRAGIRRFTVVVGEDEGSVAIWLMNKWHPDARVEFVPRKHQRGTAAALFAARDKIDAPFLIASCDAILPDPNIAELCAYFENHPEDVGVLSLHHSPNDIAEVGGVLMDPRGYVAFVSEQPSGGHQGYMTALPVFGFRPSVLQYLDKLSPEGESGEKALPTFIRLIIDDGGLIGTVEAADRIRLNDEDDLLQANIQTLAALPMAGILSDIPTSVEITDPVYIDAGVTVGEGAKLGPNVYLESGSIIGERTELKNSVVLGVRVGRDRAISDSVIHQERL